MAIERNEYTDILFDGLIAAGMHRIRSMWSNREYLRRIQSESPESGKSL